MTEYDTTMIPQPFVTNSLCFSAGVRLFSESGIGTALFQESSHRSRARRATRFTSPAKDFFLNCQADSARERVGKTFDAIRRVYKSEDAEPYARNKVRHVAGGGGVATCDYGMRGNVG